MRRMLSVLLFAATVVGIRPLAAQVPTRVMGAPVQDASRAFIDVMVPHHEMAIMMSEHALTAARSPAVREMARRMIDTQTKEIAELKAERRALFGSDSTRSSMMRGMMAMMGMQRMQDSGTMRPMMDSMRQHRGQMRPDAPRAGMPARPMMPMMAPGAMADMDRMYLRHMIAHHEEGMDVAVLAEESKAAPRVRELARRMREGQERDVAAMRRLLATLPVAAGAQ